MNFLGNSDMAKRVADFDWGTTPLGPLAQWQASLKTTVSIVLNARHPMFLWWGTELIQIYNDAYVPSFGVGKHPAALGQRGRECWPEIWTIIGPQIENVLAGGASVLHEDALVPIARNGRIEDVYWTYSYSPVFDDHDRIGGVLVTCLETTERVQNALALELAAADRDRLLNDAPVATAVLVGPDLTYQLANHFYLEIIGRENIVGKPFAEVYPELVDSPIHRVFLEVYRTGMPYISPETHVVLDLHGRLQDRYYHYNLAPLRTAAGLVYGLVVIVVDITQQVASRNEVERLNVELREASDTKDAFLAMLGHELRNPLAPIVTALRLMKLKDSTTSREQEVIKRQVEHVVRLVDDLLDVSKITRGKVELRLNQAKLDEVVAKAVEMAEYLLEQKQHRLHVDVPEGVMWLGDSARFAQVIANLLTNAARYTPKGGSIDVHAVVVDGWVQVSVTDTGIGIPPELLPKVFDLFVQGHRNNDRAEGGMGIGLTLVRNLVEMHGGTVAAQSAGPGHGSRFTVRLPMVTEENTAAARAPERQPGAPDRSLKILLVDDNQDAANALSEMLQLYGHDVRAVYDPLAALEVLERVKPDIAILDIGLPGMDGNELAVRILSRAGAPAPRLIALTGYGQQTDRSRSLASGFSAHLVKPVDVDELLRVLQQ